MGRYCPPPPLTFMGGKGLVLLRANFTYFLFSKILLMFFVSHIRSSHVTKSEVKYSVALYLERWACNMLLPGGQELHLPVWAAGQAKGGGQLRHQGLLPRDIQREGKHHHHAHCPVRDPDQNPTNPHALYTVKTFKNYALNTMKWAILIWKIYFIS